MREVSRSAIVARKACEMKRYLAYEFRSTGVSPKDFKETPTSVNLGALPKVRGAIFHAISLAIVEGATTKEWQELLTRQADVLPPSVKTVQSTLIRRAMLGWELIRGPLWRADFDVISAEQAWKWAITPTVYQPLRMDKILRRKSDNALGIFDYKTMGSFQPNWPRQMEISDQTHTYIQALKERSGEFVLGMCYDGVIIGKMYKGVQKSPFVTGYLKGGKMTDKWSAGAETVDLCAYSDDKWLEWIHDKLGKLTELYVTTGFINPPADLLLHTRASIGRAEEEWLDRVDVVEGIRKDHGEDSPEYAVALGLIERNPDNCFKYGVDYACPFVEQCWQGFNIDDDFEPRVNHHGTDDDTE